MIKVTSAITQQEFIGLDVKIARSRHSNLVGITGKILDETRNTILLLHQNQKKIIIKDTSVFHFSLQDGTIVEIEGKTLVGRPEDRIKKRIKRLW